MEIKVKHSIWSKPINIATSMREIVIWYSYIESSWIQYITINQEGKTMYRYWVELEESKDEFNLSFI